MTTEPIAAGDPRYDGWRITELWAFLAVDPADDQEGVAGFDTGGAMMPMICSDARNMESLRPIAQQIARVSGRTIRLARFTIREDLEEIAP